MILENTKCSEAQILASNALKRIRTERFIEGELELKFTVSMGVAELLNGESTDAWMKRADEALYKSKTNGRDQLTLAPNIIYAGDPAA